MSPYLDAGFLLTIFVKASGTSVAHGLLRQSAPFSINSLHQLQTENLLVSLRHSFDPNRQTVAVEGQRLWRNYLAEGVLGLVEADWNSALRLALSWNARYREAPPPPLLLLHPALALVAGATDFFSFDPRSRAVAKAAGLRLQPARL